MSISLYFYPFKGFLRCKIVSFSNVKVSLKFIQKVAFGVKINNHEVVVISFECGELREYNIVPSIKVRECDLHTNGVLPIKDIDSRIDNIPKYPKYKLTKYNLLDNDCIYQNMLHLCRMKVKARTFTRARIIRIFRGIVRRVINVSWFIRKLMNGCMSKIFTAITCSLFVNKFKKILIGRMNSPKDTMVCMDRYFETGLMDISNYTPVISVDKYSDFVKRHMKMKVVRLRKKHISEKRMIDLKRIFIVGKSIHIVGDNMLSDYLNFIGIKIAGITKDIWCIIIDYLMMDLYVD